MRAPTPRRVYLARIAARLRRDGHRVRIIDAPIKSLPATADWLLWFERVAYRSKARCFEPDNAVSPVDFQGLPDLTIDLAGDLAAGPALRLAFPEGFGETGLVGAFLDRKAATLRIERLTEDGSCMTVLEAVLAAEFKRSLTATLEQATARLGTLLSQAASNYERVPPSPCDRVAPALPASAALRCGADILKGRILKRLLELVRHPDHWRVALRATKGPGIMESRAWGTGRWLTLRDDARRYYADPFLFAHGGRTWLFCEEYPYATQKGILSVAEVVGDGTVETPRPFLETDAHLSWPQVFAHEGQIYMVPECAGANRIELWRAEDFPHKWVLDRVLLHDVRAHDPLLHLTPRGAFLLATLDDDGGSKWDALGLFTAPELFGPWAAHPNNPILVDAGSARPAGPIVRVGRELWRPSQDCRNDYGAGLALCRILRLDENGYKHEVATELGAPPIPFAQGAHTLCRAGKFEAIDWRGPRLRFP